MAQNTIVHRDIPRYTRADFTALRAWLNRLGLTQIAERYYTEDEREALGLDAAPGLEARLALMRDHLIARAVAVNPLLAEGLRNARSSERWSKVAMDYLFQAAEFISAQPQPGDALAAWFKPRLARNFSAEGIRTLAELLALIERHGPGWWRPLPRIGEGKAAAILRWLRAQEATLGPLAHPDTREPAPVDGRFAPITLRPQAPILVPLEAIVLPSELDGSRGLNRAPRFSLIQAANDLEAIHAYLVKFRDRGLTFRAYRKELERLLLWSIYTLQKPLSSLMVEDCEAYKVFLADPPETWCGPKKVRWSALWRPFEGPLAPTSRHYAVTVIQTFFRWLIDVRYLAGNPWVGVSRPTLDAPVAPMQIDKALPEKTWRALSAEGGYLDQAIGHAPAPVKGQLRLARAAILLVGTAGVRRAEAAGAQRSCLRPIDSNPLGLWELQVLGKRRKWRTVFLDARTVGALRDHWQDRGEDFSARTDALLLSPLVIPNTAPAFRKHMRDGDEAAGGRGGRGGRGGGDDDGEGHGGRGGGGSAGGAEGNGSGVVGRGFAPDALGRLITRSLRWIADCPAIAISAFERELLRTRGVHDLRHTFGTVAAGQGLPLDVLQRVMGHASLQTTSIYVRAERRRSIEEMSKFFGG